MLRRKRKCGEGLRLKAKGIKQKAKVEGPKVQGRIKNEVMGNQTEWAYFFEEVDLKACSLFNTQF
jgi:hypothetical protein